MKRKNIVIIMSDEQSWNTVGRHLYPVSVTPHLDQLASEGIAMNQCHTAYPLCCPARASLWSGMMPHVHQVTENWRSIREDLKDDGLARHFKRAGYHTIYTGKWHVPGTTPHRFHFDDCSAIPEIVDGKDRGRFIKEYREYAGAQGYLLHETNPENLTDADIRKLQQPGLAPCGTADIPEEHFLETWQTGKFVEALDRRAPDHPFFAVCSYNAPHFPMIVPAPYDRLIRPEDLILPDNFLTGWESKPQEVLDSPYFQEMQGLGETEWRRFIAHYLGLCALLDKQVGRIVDYLREKELNKDTIIVFLSDHGDMMGAHGLVKKGFELLYEEALKVPLIMAGDGIAVGKESDALVSLVDVLPTLAELTGVRIDQPIDGRSFADVLGNPNGKMHREYVLAESFKIGGGRFNPQSDSFNLSIRTKDWKYIFRYRDREELYDLETDPCENVNVAANPSKAGVLEMMRDLLLAEMRRSDPFIADLIASRWTNDQEEAVQ